jgi:hypothetical protein
MTKGFDLLRLAGTKQQVHFVFDPTDTTHMWRRSFTGRLRTLSALEYTNPGYHGLGFEIAEER